MDHQDLIQHVIARVDLITPFARAAYQAQGRGVVVSHIDALTDAATEDVAAPDELFNFVPLSYIPKGDDFRPIIAEYDPETEFVILLGGLPEDGEVLLRLKQDGSDALRRSE